MFGVLNIGGTEVFRVDLFLSCFCRLQPTFSLCRLLLRSKFHPDCSYLQSDGVSGFTEPLTYPRYPRGERQHVTSQH